MPNQRAKLIIILAVLIIIVVIHNVLQEPISNKENWLSEMGWHYWLALVYGLFVAYYMLALKCKSCGKKQIWRNNNILDFRLPKDNCWNCGKDY